MAGGKTDKKGAHTAVLPHAQGDNDTRLAAVVHWTTIRAAGILTPYSSGAFDLPCLPSYTHAHINPDNNSNADDYSDPIDHFNPVHHAFSGGILHTHFLAYAFCTLID